MIDEWDDFDRFLEDQDHAESEAAAKAAGHKDEVAQQQAARAGRARNWMEQTVRPALQELAQKFEDRGQGWMAHLTPAAPELPPSAGVPNRDDADPAAAVWAQLRVTKDQEMRFAYRLDIRDDEGTVVLRKSITGYDPTTGAVRENLGWGKFRSDLARTDPTAITRDEIIADFRDDFEFRMKQARR